MKHIIAVVVENQPGVLARVVGLISGRGYNIDSLNVAPTQDASTSRITMVVPGDDRVLEQVTKQLNKLVDVIAVEDLTSASHVERELVMIKVSANSKKRAEVTEIAAIFRAKVVDLDASSMSLEVTGAGGLPYSRNGQFAAPPQFAVYRGDSQVHTGTFEYG